MSPRRGYNILKKKVHLQVDFSLCGGLVSDGIKAQTNERKQINYEKTMEKWSKYNEVRQKSNTSIKMCRACRGRLVCAGERERDCHSRSKSPTFEYERKARYKMYIIINFGDDAQNYVMENEDRMKTEPPRLETG